jgi:hypothetical protein
MTARDVSETAEFVDKVRRCSLIAVDCATAEGEDRHDNLYTQQTKSV